jgi:hypothetical protein
LIDEKLERVCGNTIMPIFVFVPAELAFAVRGSEFCELDAVSVATARLS